MVKVAQKFIPTLQETRSLEAVIRLESISAAARELNITQPTISYHISKMEGKWGVKLFRKKGKKLEPTEFLHGIAPEIRTVTHQLEQIGSLVGNHCKREVLSIGTTPSLAVIVLQPRLHKFLERFPATDIRICASNRFLNLEEERIDVALRLLPRPSVEMSRERANMMIPAPKEQMRVVCTPDYFARLTGGRGHPIEPDAALLANAQLIYEDESVAWTKYLSTHVGDVTGGAHQRLTFNNADLILHAAIAGNGFALLRDIFVVDALRDGRLVEPFVQRLDCERVFQFVAPENIGLQSAAYNFVTWFSDELLELLT